MIANGGFQVLLVLATAGRVDAQASHSAHDHVLVIIRGDQNSVNKEQEFCQSQADRDCTGRTSWAFYTGCMCAVTIGHLVGRTAIYNIFHVCKYHSCGRLCSFLSCI